MEFLIKIIRILEVIGFLIANLAVIILFSHYIPNAPPILYIVTFLVTIIILKNQWFISSTGTRRNVSIFQSVSVFIKNLIITKIPIIKMFVITTKQMFYNVLFELFPVLVIWLCVFGLAYFIGVIFSFTMIIENSSTFFGIVTLFGIILGVFQYYLQRHEDKITSQISFYSNQIISIINEETNFQNFYMHLEEIPDGHEVQKWIERRINQKYKLIDLLKEVTEEKDRKFFLDIVKNSNYESVLTIKESIPTSDKQFELIELYAKGGAMHEKLFKAYKWYFDDAKRLDEIYSKLTDQIEIDGFTKLVLGNINIIQEVLPLFVNVKFKNFFEQSLIEQDFSQFTPHSAIEFRSLLIFKLYNRIMRSVLS
jgi:hypothetical protein